MRAKFRFRIRIIALALMALALVIVAKLYTLQILHGSELRTQVDDQNVAPVGSALHRGTIYFTQKDGTRIPAATLQSGYTLAIQPAFIEDANLAYTRVQSVLPAIDREQFLAAAARSRDTYEEISRRVDEEAGQALSALEVRGVLPVRDRWRFYPAGTLAAHEIGFLGYAEDGRTFEGRYGLERTYDPVLSRADASKSRSFVADLVSDVSKRLTPAGREAGGDVVTALEPTVQRYLEDTLKAYAEAWQPRTLGGIIMDPQTGAILAMASLPTYDPNDIKNADPNALTNPLVSSVLEFGSTMKPITMAAALDANVVTPETTYNDTGILTIDKKTIRNFDGKARGVVPMQEVLSQSLNIGIAHIVEKMGPTTMRDYLQRFGITEETGIDLPSEATPLVRNLESPRIVEYITAGYGQGVAISPIAMTRALATLANRGQVPQPHVAVSLEYPGGISKPLGWAPPRQAIRQESAHEVTTMLVKVVDTALRGGGKKIPELSVAAKTGTAQIADPERGGYYADRYLHSFFGYFPAYDARFLVFLYSVEPQGAKYASETWTDPFFNLTTFLMTYYGVPYDRATTTPVSTL